MTPLRFAAAIVFAGCASGQLPDFYKRVDRITWVVEDLDRTVAGWKSIGYSQIFERGEAAMDLEVRGKPARTRVRYASAWLGEVWVDWIQILEGDTAYSEFLKARGSGVFALNHHAPTCEALDAETGRLRGHGVNILQRGEIGANRYVHFDTLEGGKYVLGVFCGPESPRPGPSGPRLSQYAFAVRDLAPVSAYWSKLGWPEMAVTRSLVNNPRYRGKPVTLDLQLGWHRHGAVVYEWCLQPEGASVYADHIRRHGEGFQHFGMPVADMDAALERWKALGFEVAQSGGWGSEGQPGSGRFAYMDTDSIGGVSVELLWSFPRPAKKDGFTPRPGAAP